MIRKLILPALAVLLLAGCVTGYTHRTAPGDYYYGSPTTVYRDYYYGGYYPYYGRYYSPYSMRGYYRYGYGYPYYYGRYPTYPHSPRPGNDGDRTPDRKTPTWRDLDRIGHEARPDVPRADQIRMRPARPVERPARVQQSATPIRRATAPVRATPRPSAEHRGSSMSEMIRRAHSKGDGGRTIEE